VPISRQTRRNIIDWLSVESVAWNGRLSEEAFLDRIVDLDALPSTDPRFHSARSDIRQHRVHNYDWTDDWIYSYEPVSLISTSDGVFGTFLAEMLHPIVRPDSDEARSLAGDLNDLLTPDGLGLYEVGSIGPRPVWELQPLRSGRRHKAPASELERRASRMWTNGFFRLFLGHVSAHKIAVSHLRRELGLLGVSAFVAHEDIEPSLEWQAEIEFALSTMNALAALLTPDFHASKWTDQEVGIAIGQGSVVLPVRVPENPYGFIAKHQALRGDLAAPKVLAGSIVDTFLRNPATAGLMRWGLVAALEASPSFAASKAVSLKIVETQGFSGEELTRIESAITSTSQVGDSFGVPPRLNSFVQSMRSPASRS
jgi:hypothetical protein